MLGHTCGQNERLRLYGMAPQGISGQQGRPLSRGAGRWGAPGGHIETERQSRGRGREGGREAEKWGLPTSREALCDACAAIDVGSRFVVRELRVGAARRVFGHVGEATVHEGHVARVDQRRGPELEVAVAVLDAA